MSTIYFIGTSGWHYVDWQGRFYPADMPKKNWLEFYASSFSTVELNNTFYRQPSEKAVENWHDTVPSGFTFAVKANRFITHVKRLKDTADSLDRFFTVIRPLGKKLGPVLYQLPPGFKRDERRLEEFLKLLPNNLDHVFEFRHDSWFVESVFHILRRHGAGLCIYDMPDFRTPAMATTGFAYVRFHGKQNLYGGSYTKEELGSWAKEIAALKVVRTYVYFNNDIHGFALDNARMMTSLLK